MKWSRPRQQMALKLQAIEQAAKAAAEARLADAERAAGEAKAATEEAKEALEAAEQGWAGHLSSDRLDLELGRLLAARLTRSDGELATRRHWLAAADDRRDGELGRWRLVEAKVRLGEDVLRRGRRALARQLEARHDQEIAERSTWKWFSR